MRRIRIVSAAVLVVLASFAAITLVALEGQDVVVLRTFDAQGRARETRTWIAAENGSTWIEAATPERPFLGDVRDNPNIEVQRSAGVQRCRATVADNPEGHARIRRLLAAKYGWADAWIGRLTDTSRSLAVRLECQDPTSGSSQQEGEKGHRAPIAE
jgi:hypothetical protein